MAGFAYSPGSLACSGFGGGMVAKEMRRFFLQGLQKELQCGCCDVIATCPWFRNRGFSWVFRPVWPIRGLLKQALTGRVASVKSVVRRDGTVDSGRENAGKVAG